MKPRLLFLSGATITSTVCLALLLSSRAASQTDEEKAPEPLDFSFKQPTPEEMEALVEAYMKTTQPSKHHKWLEQLLGEWRTTSTVWMAGPDGPPTKSEGSAKFSWAVPGKWLRQEWEGTMMGTPMTGFGVLGYDNFKKKFVGSWFDSLSTALLTFEGLLDKSGKVLNQWGPMDEPMTGEHDKTVRYTTRFVGPDKFIFEIHDLAIGGDATKVIEMEYARKD